jgi:hypothetical protein
VKHWARAGRYGLCGGCGKHVDPDTPVLLLIIGHIVKVRCQACEGPAPELPARVPPVPLVPVAKQMARFVARAVLPFDYKTAAAGERDPGEEG